MALSGTDGTFPQVDYISSQLRIASTTPTTGISDTALPTNPTTDSMLREWTRSESFAFSSATRDSNEAIVTASVVWPDGGTGVFTTDIASVSFPGAIDAYHVTYTYNPGTGNIVKTITQVAVTRDVSGAVTVEPDLSVG